MLVATPLSSGEYELVIPINVLSIDRNIGPPDKKKWKKNHRIITKKTIIILRTNDIPESPHAIDRPPEVTAQMTDLIFILELARCAHRLYGIVVSRVSRKGLSGTLFVSSNDVLPVPATINSTDLSICSPQLFGSGTRRIAAFSMIGFVNWIEPR